MAGGKGEDERRRVTARIERLRWRIDRGVDRAVAELSYRAAARWAARRPLAGLGAAALAGLAWGAARGGLPPLGGRMAVLWAAEGLGRAIGQRLVDWLLSARPAGGRREAGGDEAEWDGEGAEG